MEKRVYRNVNETVYYEKLANGLEVYLIPKPEYVETCIAFATKFGSFDSTKRVQTPQGFRKAEDGIAHFLEHRMFDNKRGQVFDLFSQLGAISNAFTSYDKTVYYVITADQVAENVELMLDVVQDFEVSEASVEKEKDIIIQELRMYNDMPDFRLYRGLLTNLYHYHPIRTDVGGSEESVRATDRALLVACHQTFYHPNNMILIVSGNVNPDQLITVIRHNQEKKTFADAFPFEETQNNEPGSVFKENEIISMPVNLAKTGIGYKLPPLDKNLSGFDKNKLLQAYSIYVSLLFSRSGPYYQKWIMEGLISPSFEASHLEGEGYNSIVVMAESPRPDDLIKEIDEAIKSTSFDTLKAAFELRRRTEIGVTLRSMNSPKNEAMNFLSNLLQGTSIFDDIQTLEALSIDDIKRISQLVQTAPRTVFQIEPTPSHG